ncbi:ArsR/SmtB family transcription factor [Meridianimarinicoccus aquatilis]|uniref:Transcriptional regulator n=1 Tax=Meridianimarinicoccus aquatilis TaxID=2552766 RepID=A0A4R6B187_9RHOB|nr:helix-turn-helix domain-containing protein [Fluviibacterium aquatile]QIE43754.1 helix-turn-helix transcriptional regulator [Rhodobacteraceae bacterium SC52]TDL90417.1 transcriptional regulator [Fluviibacterium aquatile]
MEKTAVLDALAALAQPTRLDVVRLLMQAGPDTGMAAGDIAHALDARANTLSANLSILLNAGLVRKERIGRSIRYYPEIETMRGLLGFLLEDCCGGNPALCRPLLDTLTDDCPPQKRDRRDDHQH